MLLILALACAPDVATDVAPSTHQDPPEEDTGPGGGSGGEEEEEEEAELDVDADGYPVSEDCDDDDPAIHPGAQDGCDAVDNDCDGDLDEDGDSIRIGGSTPGTVGVTMPVPCVEPS